jgi:threonine aldolase
VHFSSGGTLANLIVLAAILRPHHAVICTSLGHINTHETGAIEATGHKVYAVPGQLGKLNVEAIETVMAYHDDEHMVKPQAVYLSQSTELGTVYSLAELRAISEYCQVNGLYLYVDGARFGAAMNCADCDISYGEFARLVDAFYIGGTKNGAIYGEAIVICREELKTDFRYSLKHHGALLGKTAAMGIQFTALFEDGLYDRLALYANNLAAKLADGISALGYDLLVPTQTNQVFPLLPPSVAERLHALYDFHDWQKIDNMSAVRLVVSWATPESMVELLLSDLATL